MLLLCTCPDAAMLGERSNDEDLHRLVITLGDMSLVDLRSFWSARWGFPPRLRSVALLRHLIAWRLQAEVHGGLDAPTAHLLNTRRPLTCCMPPAGTRLRREFRGVVHEVEVLADGFRYAGRDFENLTAIADAITGTHTPGPRFFGLRPRNGQL